MRVLVLGANGFVGAAVVTALREAGMTVRGIVRDPEKLARRFPGIEAIAADLRESSTHDPGHWREALDGVDTVVNAAGVLRPRRARDAWAVHLHAPDALYAECERMRVERVIHVSAIGVEESDTVYARSKRAGERALMARDLSWTVLRPTIVIGDGSYGGTSMLRAMAAFPWITPVIGDGGVAMGFTDHRDLARSIVALLRTGAASASILEPAAPGRMTLSEAVSAYRRWLGLRPLPIVGVPRWCVGVLARIGDVARLDPMTTTAVAQYEARLTGDAPGLTDATGVAARGLSEAFPWIKWAHVLGATLLFGTGLDTAFHMFATYRRGDVGAIAAATRNTVLADRPAADRRRRRAGPTIAQGISPRHEALVRSRMAGVCRPSRRLRADGHETRVVVTGMARHRTRCSTTYSPRRDGSASSGGSVIHARTVSTQRLARSPWARLHW